METEETFKVIINGGRDFKTTIANRDAWTNTIIRTIDSIKPKEFKLIEIVSGEANGADKFGEEIAELQAYKLTKMPAKWDVFEEGDPRKWGKYGAYNPIAGLKRNKEMGKYAHALISLWDLKSTGTKDMIEFMLLLKKPVTIFPYKL